MLGFDSNFPIDGTWDRVMLYPIFLLPKYSVVEEPLWNFLVDGSLQIYMNMKNKKNIDKFSHISMVLSMKYVDFFLNAYMFHWNAYSYQFNRF